MSRTAFYADSTITFSVPHGSDGVELEIDAQCGTGSGLEVDFDQVHGADSLTNAYSGPLRGCDFSPSFAAATLTTSWGGDLRLSLAATLQGQPKVVRLKVHSYPPAPHCLATSITRR